MKKISKTLGAHYFISMFVIGVALFCTFSIVIYRHYDNSLKLNSWVIYNYELARRGRLVLVDLLNMETGVRGYLLTGKQDFLQPYNEALKDIPQKIDDLTKYKKLGDNDNNEMVEWISRIDVFKKLLATQVAIQRSLSHAQLIHTLDQQKAQMDGLRHIIETNVNSRVDEVHGQIEQSRYQQKRFLWILITGTVLAILAMFLTTLAILGLLARSKKAHENVELAEERFRAVMNGLGDGVYDYYPLDHKVYYSPAYYEMLGYNDEEFPQELNSANRYMHPDDAQEVWKTIERYSKREMPHFNVAFRMLHKDGTWRWMLSRGIGFWNKRGELIRLIGTHSDITEQKKREDELVQLNSELETYTFIASHDLRSPLVNLRGFARELVTSIDELTPVIKRIQPTLGSEESAMINRTLENDIPEAIQFIIKSADRMDTLTTAVLDLSRIGRRQYTRIRISVNEIVQKCLDSQAYEISRNGIEIIVDPLPHIFSDPLALEQIFANLIDNAIKYLEPGRPGKIQVKAHETASDVVFEVHDNGRGIATPDLSKVFEIFRRARNTNNVRGQGMGMAFVQATIRKLGGNIWCNSTLGVGTTFSVRLPRIMKQEN